MSAQVPDTTQMIGFRSDLYGCFTTWSDALFEVCDAVLSSPSPVASVPSLSLEPMFRRGHGSLYKALRSAPSTPPSAPVAGRQPPGRLAARVRRGRLHLGALRRGDLTREGGLPHSASKHSAGQPIVAGSSSSGSASSTSPPARGPPRVDAIRVPPTADATAATVAQYDK